MAHPPIALTIAGSDSGGGAGIQADLKAFSARGVYGASVITAITAQNTQAVTAVHAVPVDVVAAQIDAVLSDLDVAAVKIGMLFSPELVDVVARGLEGFGGTVVLDPVMIAKSGDALLQDEAVAALVERMVPRADLITPNLPEAARLLGDAEVTGDTGERLLALGPKAVLIKGGHGEGDVCEDVLLGPDGPRRFAAPRIDTRNTHGTGCSYSSAIAAECAKGQDMAGAVEAAHGWLHGAIRAADGLRVGHGHGPVHHFHELWA
ncbi:bifunctional hydroxymethylpyrimidine kinase/phosphomethylpyrimidine kinase [Pseudaestuariivita atlantica]|uniref:hydroxymethylpyrimidine kinase n=1 Tax=Pseudaestuariivita atlantica TaxID=1317121 RepID=A0A0L1JNI8_9RHOB|nr:bifunctional hydroxymethylpyrimidine kinase/phosphomethylpyrimidine kinase [Pseudaestuariivita atlantica]KNG93287.1 hydroxymethylpyrimidine kinase [Pseudaestuariivita atlantica]